MIDVNGLDNVWLEWQPLKHSETNIPIYRDGLIPSQLIGYTNQIKQHKIIGKHHVE